MKKTITLLLISVLFVPLLVFADTTVTSPEDIRIIASSEEANISWKNPSDPNFSEVVIFSSTIPIEDYFSFQALEGLCDKLYEGQEENYLAKDLAPNLPYYFIIFSKSVDNEYSKAKVLIRKAGLTDKVRIESPNESETQSKQSQENTNNSTANNSGNGTSANGTLAGASAQVVDEVSLSEAEIVYNYNQRIENPSSPDSSRLSLFIIVKSPHDMSEQDKNAISYFIDQGTPTTILLGAGERTGVLNSYLSVFNKLPRDVLEWQDVIKIANGRWPSERNQDAEEKAANDSFSAIYQRAANMDNAFDNAAVTVIAYGLRPANRNMESEAAAIKIYESIFGKSPVEAYEWDMVRAIAYSGAVR